MKFSMLESLAKSDPSYLYPRYCYSPKSFPSYGVGVRLSMDDGYLVFEVLHLLSQDGRKKCCESDDINVLTNILEIPLEVRELGCLIERKLNAWKSGSYDSIDFELLGGDSHFGRMENPNE